MRNITFFKLFLLICFASSLSAGEVCGLWQTFDKTTHKPSSVIAVYRYQGKYYGRIIATCNKQGCVNETLEQRSSRAPGLPGNPYYCGLDIFWEFSGTEGSTLKGHVIDPRNGNMYNAKLWTENGNLVLRGEVLIFGKNEILGPYQPHASDFVPNMAAFVPVYCKH